MRFDKSSTLRVAMLMNFICPHIFTVTMKVTSKDYVYRSSGLPVEYEVNDDGLFLVTKFCRQFKRNAYDYFARPKTKQFILASPKPLVKILGINQFEGCRCSTEFFPEICVWLKSHIEIAKDASLTYELDDQGLLELTKLCNRFGRKACEYFATKQAQRFIEFLGINVIIIKGRSKFEGCRCSIELLPDILKWLKLFVPSHEIPENKECFRCKEFKSLTAFDAIKKTRICQSCENKRKKSGINSNIEKFFTNTLSNIRHRSNTKREAGRSEFVECKITVKELIEIFDKQKGLCFYSRIPMIPMIGSDYKVSVERLNNSVGYILTNIVLCCHEMNGICQWTDNKIQKLFEEISQPFFPSSTIFQLRNQKKQKFDNVDASNRKCRECGIIKLIKCFPSTSICTQCRMKTPIRKLQDLLSNSKHNARNYSGDHTLTMEQIQAKYYKQDGRCYYSRIPLTFDWEKDFNMSLERIDPKLNYTDENVVLIAKEFNIGFNGSWTKEKFAYFRSCYLMEGKTEGASSHLNI